MVLGVHVPLQLPFKQTPVVHAGFGCQVPVASQLSGVVLLRQALELGVQTPLQTPAEQTYGQTVPGVHAPADEQVSGVRPLHILSPGLHEPPHTPAPLQT